MPGLVEVKLIVQRVLIKVRQDQDPPAQERLAGFVLAESRRERIMAGDVEANGQADLFFVVDACNRLNAGIGATCEALGTLPRTSMLWTSLS